MGNIVYTILITILAGSSRQHHTHKQKRQYISDTCLEDTRRMKGVEATLHVNVGHAVRVGLLYLRHLVQLDHLKHQHTHIDKRRGERTLDFFVGCTKSYNQHNTRDLHR